MNLGDLVLNRKFLYSRGDRTEHLVKDEIKKENLRIKASSFLADMAHEIIESSAIIGSKLPTHELAPLIAEIIAATAAILVVKYGTRTSSYETFENLFKHTFQVYIDRLNG